MDGSGALFARFVAALGSDLEAQVVRYPVSGEQSIEALTAHARAALPERGPYLLLGESFSGPIAISLAAERPAGLRGLVLCASFARCPLPMLRSLTWLVDLLPLGFAPSILLRWALLGGARDEDLRTSLHQALSPLGLAARRARLRGVLQVDVRDSLAEIDTPLLYLRATRDRIVAASAAEEIAALHERTTIAEIDAPHLLLQCAADAAAETVRDFVARTALSG